MAVIIVRIMGFPAVKAARRTPSPPSTATAGVSANHGVLLLQNSDHDPCAFYGVFDGHGGKHAADFASYHLPRFIAEGENLPRKIGRAI